MSMAQASFFDMSGASSIAKPYTFKDMENDMVRKEIAKGYQPLKNKTSALKEAFVDYSGRKDALRPIQTCWTKEADRVEGWKDQMKVASREADARDVKDDKWATSSKAQAHRWFSVAEMGACRSEATMSKAGPTKAAKPQVPWSVERKRLAA